MIVFLMDIESNDDRDKVVRLYNDYRNLMRKVAYEILEDNELAEDAVHDSFVKIIKHLHKIDENNVPQTRNYLAVICRNTALDLKSTELPLSSDGDVDNLEDQGKTNDYLGLLIKKETVHDIAAAIESLEDIYRDTFLLRRVHNHSLDEISEIMNVSTDNVKKRLARAKSKIMGRLIRREVYEQR